MLPRVLFTVVMVGLALLGLVWLGIITLPATPEQIPPPDQPKVIIPPFGNQPIRAETDTEEAPALVLKGLVVALGRADTVAVATYFSPDGNARVRDMATRAGQEGGCVALLTFWRGARLTGMTEIEDDYRGTLFAGPGARRPFRIVFRLNEREQWLIRAIHPLPKD